MKSKREKVSYRALLDFDSKIKSYLTIQKGDILYVYTKNMQENWWNVKNKRTGKKGMVPKNFLIRNEINYENYEGFFNLTRTEAYLKLMIPNINSGTFLIRPTSDICNLALSLKFEKSPGVYDVAHYLLIQRGQNNIFIEENCIFQSIVDLVNHYSVNPKLRVALKQMYSHHLSLPPLDECEIPRKQIECQRLIGKGNFAEVFVGKWCQKIDIAVKCIENTQLNAKKFLEEAKLIQKLHHPNILQLIGICTESKTEPFLLVTEYMPQGSIKNFLRVKTRSEILTEHLIDMIYQIAKGMSYLSSNKVVHRDLRADNILISNDFVIKIADFGMARLIPDAIYVSKSNDVSYPKKWAAPELIQSENQFTEKTDVWSYGITCYEVLSRGGTPYQGESGDDVLKKVKIGYTMTFPPSFVCPKDIRKLISCCWELNPNERPTFSILVDKFRRRYGDDN